MEGGHNCWTGSADQLGASPLSGSGPRSGRLWASTLSLAPRCSSVKLETFVRAYPQSRSPLAQKAKTPTEANPGIPMEKESRESVSLACQWPRNRIAHCCSLEIPFAALSSSGWSTQGTDGVDTGYWTGTRNKDHRLRVASTSKALLLSLSQHLNRAHSGPSTCPESTHNPQPTVNGPWRLVTRWLMGTMEVFHPHLLPRNRTWNPWIHESRPRIQARRSWAVSRLVQTAALVTSQADITITYDTVRGRERV